MTINISGKVIKGQQYGRVLGFPTANLDRREYVRKKMKIRFGIWAGGAIVGSRLEVQGSRNYKAAIVIGPLDSHHLPKIEAHLLNFKGNLYGKKITITLHKYLRPFKKYNSSDEIITQITKDIKLIKKIL